MTARSVRCAGRGWMGSRELQRRPWQVPCRSAGQGLRHHADRYCTSTWEDRPRGCARIVAAALARRHVVPAVDALGPLVPAPASAGFAGAAEVFDAAFRRMTSERRRCRCAVHANGAALVGELVVHPVAQLFEACGHGVALDLVGCRSRGANATLFKRLPKCSTAPLVS
jgi:hypothetical protein